jgi:hypothetical protein
VGGQAHIYGSLRVIVQMFRHIPTALNLSKSDGLPRAKAMPLTQLYYNQLISLRFINHPPRPFELYNTTLR